MVLVSVYCFCCLLSTQPLLQGWLLSLQYSWWKWFVRYHSMGSRRLDSSAHAAVEAHFPLALEATFIICMGNRPVSHFTFH